MQDNFNSIKVRLKHNVQAILPMSVRFQFHKGTIKTKAIRRKINGGYKFQFHKGTIKTYLLGYYFLCCYVFQFHKGTIKTVVRTASRTSTAISIP